MTRLEKLMAGIIILIAVAVFFALINYLGGYGALLSAFIVAGISQFAVEQETDNNN